MGLLSFLSKQSLGDRSRPDAPPRSQAYHSTVASNPPVRGKYPVPGNGPHALIGRTRIHNKISESQLSLNFRSPSEISPVPSVPRLRDESLERPSTAPIGSHPATDVQSNTSLLKKTISRGRPAPLSIKNNNRKSSLAAESSQGRIRSDTKLATPSPVTTTGLRPRLIGTSGPGTPVRSEVLKGGFKDLLDAQSEFKPSDFKTRVKAAGVRDYGEDVADRNIGQNGVDLESPEVRGFYAQSTDDFAERRTRRASMIDMTLQYLNGNGDTRGRPASKQSTANSSLRAKSLGSSSHLPLASQSVVPPVPGLPVRIAEGSRPSTAPRLSATGTIGRRQSLTSYHSTSPVDTYRSSSLRRSLSLQRAELPRRSSLLADERPGATDSQLSPDHHRRSSLSTVRHQSLTNALEPATSAQKEHVRNGPEHSHNDIRPRQRSFSLTSRRDSAGSTTFGYPESRQRARHESVSSIASRDTAADMTGLTYPRDVSRLTSPRDERNVGTTSPTTGVGISTSNGFGTGRPSSSASAHGGPLGHTRTRSLASSLRTLKMDEIADVVPVRTSSIRNWSISSTTPTTSDTSSNPSQRPQSRHTADTSVDLRTSFSAKNSSHGSLPSAVGACSVAMSPKVVRSPAFNIDDYISSDDDDMTPRRPRGEGEEDLLFQDTGYGMNGSLLPGLSDGMPLPGLSSSPPQSQRHLYPPRTSSALSPGYLQNAYGSPTFHSGSNSHMRPKRYIIDTAAHYDDDVDGDDDYIYRDEPPPLPGLSPMRTSGQNARSMKRFNAVGKMYDSRPRSSSSSSYHHHSHHLHHHRGSEDVIEEERDMSKIDIATAVRMRKEAKARKRADAAASKKRRPSRPRTKRSLVEVADADEEHLADTEC